MERARIFLHQNIFRILFFILYTATFIAASRCVRLFLPFLLGFLLYFVLSPLHRFLLKKTNLSAKLSAYVILVLCCILIALAVILLIFLLCKEISHLFTEESYFRFGDLLPSVRTFITEFLSRIPNLAKNATADLSGTLSVVMPYAGEALKTLFSFPAVLILPVLVFSFTAFLLLHRRKLRQMLLTGIGSKKYLRLHHTLKARTKNSAGLVSSYALIYAITFSESCIVLHLLNMPYPIITALIITVSDCFPILGPGIVFLPLCIYRLLCGAYAQSIGLLAGWLLITVIRQIIEPRLISKVTHTPGIIMLTAVYISLILGNFWIIPYTALLFYLYGLLNDAGLFTVPSKEKMPAQNISTAKKP